MALGALLWACGSGEESAAPASSTTVATTAPAATAAPTTTTAVTVTVTVDGDTFVNINDLTPVRGFFVGNLLGEIDATLAVAESPNGGVYPVGSLIQLVPTEAMVKREAGFSPSTGDWEFFELQVTAEGTSIRVRGGDEVVNQFGGSCASCHAKAAPRWDHVCEQDHGCDPLPLSRDLITTIQQADPRPRQR